ncbi:putative Arabinose efflux permease family protein [metagenome]|uniref:Putative Arabinose efflux permease family protein n=1 Tax=metagenome TaxID=256318 RepID=A0A2P2CA13_9ZZZZ
MGPTPRVVSVYAVAVAGVTLPSPLYVTYQDRWDLPSSAVAGLYALYPVGVLLVLALAGSWSDDLGRRRVVILGLTASLLSATAMAGATGVAMVAAGRLLTGIASGCVVSAAGALLVELAPWDRRRHASVTATTTNQLGLGAGALVSGVVTQFAPTPERLVFALHAVALLGALALTTGIPETVPRTGRPRLRLRRFALPHQRRGVFLGLSLAAFSAFALCGLLAALAPDLVRSELDTDSPLVAGAAICLVFATSAVSQYGWRRVNDPSALRWGLWLLVASLGIINVAVAQGLLPVFLIGIAVGGVAVGGVFMSTAALVQASTPDLARGAVSATYLSITFAGLIVPVVMTGFLADTLSQVQAIEVFSISMALSALLAGRLSRTAP